VVLTDEAALAECERDVAAAEAALRAVGERRAKAEARAAALRSGREQLAALRTLDADVAALRGLRFLEIAHVRVADENFPRLVAALADRPVLVVRLGSADRRTTAILAWPRSAANAVGAALGTLFAERATLPDGLAGRPAEALRQVDDELAVTDLELRRLAIEKDEAALRHRRRLGALVAQLRASRVVADLERLTARAGRARLLSAWIPAEAERQVVDAIARATGGAAVVRVEPAPLGAGRGEAHGEGAPHRPPVPTRLRNPALLRPFEALVGMYGRPAYGEIDPTPIVALSFVAMFGMMFGDLGQGAVLFLLGWVLAWRVPSLRGPSVIVRLCSASSMLFGCLYGDAFGWHFVHPLWLKPMEDTMVFLGRTVVLGVGFMTLGLVLSLVNAIRNREWGELFFGRTGLAGIWFYWGTLIAFVVIGATVSLPLAIAIWAVPMVLMFFREPLTHALERRKRLIEGKKGEFVVSAFFELFETALGYLSNTISFVRLAAFAMNHAGLFTVVFLLAKMANAGPADRWVDGLILVVGNVFIVGLEGLVVTIQALRLEYYEFFGKFYRGTGVPFRPVSLREETTET
jgi:V/A-type H+-transporting ATPase subunit I